MAQAPDAYAQRLLAERARREAARKAAASAPQRKPQIGMPSNLGQMVSRQPAPDRVGQVRQAITQGVDYAGNFLAQGRAPEIGGAVRSIIEPVAQFPVTAVTDPMRAANQAQQALDPAYAMARGLTTTRLGAEQGNLGDVASGVTEMGLAGLSFVPGGAAVKGARSMPPAPVRRPPPIGQPNVLAPQASRGPILNQLANQPELLGGGLGGALGATQGETPEERARNALLGAAGGAVGGRMAREMTPDRTRMGSNLGNVSKQEPPKTDLASTRIPQAALQDIGKIRQIVSETKEPLYIRWSRGPKQDLKPGARSKDYSAGTEEAGLSAVRIEPEWLRESDGYIARRLREYNSAFFDDASSMFSGHIYTGRKVGTDSDGYDVIVPSKHVFKISSEFQNWSRNADNVKIAELQEGIQRTNARLSDETLDPITRGVFERSKQQQTDELNKLVSAQSPTRMGSNLGNVPKPVQKAQAAGYEGQDIGEAQEWVRARSKGLDMSRPARMERAKELGFDTGTVLYHGTGADFTEFKPSTFGHFGPGIYLTDSPRTAAAFGGGEAQSIMPVYVAGKIANQQTHDFFLESALRETTNEPRAYEIAAEMMQKNGYAGFKIPPIENYSDSSTVILFNPSSIRSTNAAFDPASKKSANILAGVGAVGAGAAMTGAIRPPEQKKPPGQRPRG